MTYGSVKPWRARISVKTGKIHLGSFATEREAAKAYLREMNRYSKRKVYQEFASSSSMTGEKLLGIYSKLIVGFGFAKAPPT